MPEKNVNCSVVACPKCGYQALLPEKTEDPRSRGMQRRDRKYIQKLAKTMRLEIVETADKCVKCGNVAKEENPISIKFSSDASVEKIKHTVEESLQQLKKKD